MCMKYKNTEAFLIFKRYGKTNVVSANVIDYLKDEDIFLTNYGMVKPRKNGACRLVFNPYTNREKVIKCSLSIYFS